MSLMRELDEETREVLCILQEECAEVTQAISKIFRFGFDSSHPTSTLDNREALEEELGDLQAMIDILTEMNAVGWGNITVAKRAKREKLKKWSNIKLD